MANRVGKTLTRMTAMPAVAPRTLVAITPVQRGINDILKRKLKAKGKVFLMPQAEETIHEDAGGPGVASPDVGNNNYASSLPSNVGTTSANMAAKPARKKVPTQAAGMKEEVIVTVAQLLPIIEDYREHEDHEGVRKSIYSSYENGNMSRATANYKLKAHGHPEMSDTPKTGNKTPDDENDILEGIWRPDKKYIHPVFKKGYEDAKAGNELPSRMANDRFRENIHHYYNGHKAGTAAKNGENTSKKGAFAQMFATEELKVGEGADGPNQERINVKRKYLGSKRGRTATGKPAHAIDVMPVIAKPDPNVNKTTPSGPRKKS
jgi:hypothetical protein